MKNKLGFIQIPIIIVLALIGVTTTAVGGYFVVKEIRQEKNDRVVVQENIEESKNINTEPPLIISLPSTPSESSKTEPKKTFTLEEITQSQKKPINLDDFIKEEQITDKSLQERDALVSQLNTLNGDLAIFDNAISEIKDRMVKSETEISDLRITKLRNLIGDSQIEIITETYKELVAIEEIRKKSIKFVMNDSVFDVLDYSLELNGLIKSLEGEEYKEWLSRARIFISSYNSRLGQLQAVSKIEIEAAIADNKGYAKEFNLRLESTVAIAQRYNATLSALEAINSAREDIEKAISSIGAESYYVPPTLITDMQTNTSSSMCKYPKSKYILVPGKGWVAVKQCDDGRYIEADKYVPDTSNMTPQQICDLRKAGSLGGSGYIQDSQSNTSCE